MSKVEYVGGAITLITALLAKYRQALKDLRVFYEIELRLCGAVVSARSTLSPNTDPRSELALKRIFRLMLRSDGMESPSDQATPQRIAQELAKL